MPKFSNNNLMSAILTITIIYAIAATIAIVVILRMTNTRTVTAFDYNNVIQRRTKCMFLDLNGFRVSDRGDSNNGHLLDSVQPGEHISTYTKVKDLEACLKSCIRHKGNITIKVEESIVNGIFKRIDLIFSPIVCSGRTQGVVVISQEMYSKNREVELLDKSRKLVEQNTIEMQKINELDTQRAELEDAFKKSSKHHIKLQKAMYRIEQQKQELEQSFEIINQQKSELERINTEIRKSNQMKEIFLANTSHEIRTPLNAIIGFTNLLLKNATDENQLKYLNNIMISGKNLLFIINDILDMSKIEAGKMELESIDFDLRKTIDNIVNTVATNRDGKNIDVKVDIDNEVPRLLVGDPYRISQMLTNLVNNSIKFTDTDCRISITVETVGKQSDNVELLFKVKDNGIGIPTDKLDEIFHNFTQANKDTTRKYGGTGLGLSITKQLVEMYNGTIRVESELGHGSTFIFNLHLKFSAQAGHDELPANNKAAISNQHISLLLVEDNEINQQLAVDTIKSWNPNVVIDIAGNGVIAVEKVKINSYDIILMDIQMPVMDGNTAARTIRSLNIPQSQTPIIAMTAHAFKEERERCLSNGMNDYVMKPFDPDDLCSTISKYTNINVPVKKISYNENEHNDLFNLSGLIEICSSDYEELERIVNIYAKSIPADLSALSNAYDNNDQTQIRMKTHSLKTAFGYLGMTSVAEMITNLEALMADNETDIVLPLAQITQEWEHTIPLILKTVNRLRLSKV